MSDLQTLYLALIVIYCVECVHRLSPEGLVLSAGSWFRRFRKLRSGEDLYQSRKAAYFLANPLPPFGTNFVLPPPVLVFGLRGVTNLLLHTVHRRTAARVTAPWFVRYEDVDAAHIHVLGQDIRLDGRVLARADSEWQAREAAATLREITQAGEDGRKLLLRARLRRSLDMTAAEHRRQEYGRAAWFLRIGALFLFAFLFFYVPWIILHFGLERTWQTLLFQAVLLWALPAGGYVYYHARLYPGNLGERMTTSFAMLVSPPFAIRAADLLSRDLFAHLHHLAAARVVLSEKRFLAFARRTVRDLTFPARKTEAEPEAIEAEREYRAMYTEHTFRALRDLGIDPDELVAAPERVDEQLLSYCPRCETQYLITGAECASCRLALVKF